MTAFIIEQFLTLWNPQPQMWERHPLLPWLQGGVHVHTQRKTAGTAHSSLSCSSGRQGASLTRTGESGRGSAAFLVLRFLHSVPVAWQDRFPWQQVTRPAGRNGAELSGFLEGVASCQGPGPSAAQTFSWLGAVATPRAKCSLPALGTGRPSQPLASGCSPGPEHVPFCLFLTLC